LTGITGTVRLLAMSQEPTSPSPAGERLRALREAVGISARELSRVAGMKSHQHVGLIERGDVGSPDYPNAKKLAGALGCSVAWLLDGDGVEPSADVIRAAVIAAGWTPPTAEPARSTEAA
jgi:transcriptional regulator with XRE-family HTH domain